MKLIKVLIFLCIFCNQSEAFLDENAKFFIDFLDEIKSSSGIVFYCNSFDYAKWKKVNAENLKYFAFFDISKSNFTEEEMNIVMNFKYHKLGVVTDLSCMEIKNFLSVISLMNFFNASYYWLLLSDNYKTSVKLLERQNINIDAEITLAVATDRKFNLFDIYNPSHKYNGDLISTFKGIYDEKFNITLHGSKFRRRSDLRGIKIHAGIVATGIKINQTLLEYLESDEEHLIDVQHRYHYQLFKLIAEQHNFSFFLHRASLWGSFYRSGTYNGILGMYQSGQIDFSIAPFRITSDRFDLVDFSALPSWVTTVNIVFRHPKNSLRNAFLQPLSPMVWYLILLIIFVVTILITLVMRYLSGKRNVSLARVFIASIGIICQQGFTENFSRSSIRLIMVIFIFFSQIIYQFYGSFLVSSLLTMPPKTINNFRQLIDSDLEIGIEDVTYNIEFFQTTNDSLVLELFERKVLHGKSKGKFYPMVQGMALMHLRKFAFSFDTSYGYKIIVDTFDDEEICELHGIPLFAPRPLFATVAKRSPFKELIMVEMMRIAESGIMSYYKRKWQTEKPECVRSITEIKAMDLDDASWILILWVAAIIASFITVIIENFHNCLRQRKNSRKVIKILGRTRK